MRLQNPMAAVSPSGLDSQVLMVLARVREHMTVEQIHRVLPEAGSKAGVRGSVMRFVEQGTVSERSNGRTRAYALNDDHLVASAVREIAASRTRLFERIAAEVESWAIAPLVIGVFGSAVRDEMRSDSDIDVLVIVPDGSDDHLVDDQVQRLAARGRAWTGNDVRPIVYLACEIDDAPLLSAFLAEGIAVVGDLAVVRRLVRASRVSA